MDNKWAIGVDIGGTKVAVAHVDFSGSVLNKINFETPINLGAGIVRNEITLAAKALIEAANTPPVGIGIGMAGQIDAKSGVVLFAPNLNWHNVPLKSDIESHLQLPTMITNDVRASTLGEWRYGAGQHCNDFVCLFIGTGIGGGIVSGGQLITGDNNSAGEFGHMTIDINGRKCTCGNTGCLESIAGGWAIAERAQENISKNSAAGKLLLNLVNGDLKKISTKIVSEGARQGDLLATEILQEAIVALTAGAVSIVNIFNPKKLILGGGVIEGIPNIIEILNRGISNRALKSASQSLEVMRGRLGADAGIIGAASLLFIR